MTRIGWVDGIGYCASLLVFCSFYMKTMIQRMVETERRWRAQGGVTPS